jgi:Domain of unknown function (DUF1918)
MKVSQGDHLVIESERVGQPPRTGTVEEVLSLDPLRVRVRWDNDGESTLTPDAGAARVEHTTE